MIVAGHGNERSTDSRAGVTTTNNTTYTKAYLCGAVEAQNASQTALVATLNGIFRGLLTRYHEATDCDSLRVGPRVDTNGAARCVDTN